MDLVEGEGGSGRSGRLQEGQPARYGRRPEAWPADRVQLCAQALILRDNGYRATRRSPTTMRPASASGCHRRRLVAETLRAVADARALAHAGSDSRRRLSIAPNARAARWWASACPTRPRSTNRCPTQRRPQLSLFDDGAGELASAAAPTATNRFAAWSRRATISVRLYVTGHGLIVGKTGEVLQIRERKKPVQEVRIGEISQVNVFGNVQFTAAARPGTVLGEKPIAHFSYGGWFYGLTQGLGLKNVFLRKRQFAWPRSRSSASAWRASSSRQRSATSGRCCAETISSRRRSRWRSSSATRKPR